ncbi:hypothetical protein NEE01_14305 [Sphingomonas sp. MMSM24]|uniref:Uncharacterized protein n=1 Tax=Sphingomonas lycopersici TaxID=2951807 RepID=A0AA42CUY9_9SPHN|nr:hypothetical protein [Sphingomonas lycopersici]
MSSGTEAYVIVGVTADAEAVGLVPAALVAIGGNLLQQRAPAGGER